MTVSLALHLLYLSLPLRHSYSVKHLGLFDSHDRNLSVSTSGVFDVMALYKLDYYYYYVLHLSNKNEVQNSVSITVNAQETKTHSLTSIGQPSHTAITEQQAHNIT